MTLTLDLVLLIAALICFVLAALSIGLDRIHLGWLGAALATLTLLV